MKIAHFTVNSEGGTATACRRIVEALSLPPMQHDVYHLKGKATEHWTKLPMPSYRLSQRLLRLDISRSKKRSAVKSFEPLSHPAMGRFRIPPSFFQQYDLLHFHHTGEAFIDFASLAREIPPGFPVVWTMHDLNAVCAVSHYLQNEGADWSLQEEQKWYGGSTGRKTLQKAFSIKQQFYRRANVHLVAISDWVLQLAQRSELGQMAQSLSKICYPLSPFYSQKTERFSHEKLGLSPHTKIICAGAANPANPRKGSALLREAICTSPHHWVLFGEKSEVFSDLDNATQLGTLDRNRLSALYDWADLFVMTSLEEGFGQTGLEAIQRGTPVIGFQHTGADEFLREMGCDYEIPARTAASINRTVDRCLSLPNQTLRHWDRLFREKFDPSLALQKYQSLYQSAGAVDP